MPAGVLVQLRLLVDEIEHPLRAGKPELHHRERERGDVRREAELLQQADKGDELADRDLVVLHEIDAMHRRQCHCRRQQQCWQVPRLHQPLLDRVIAILLRVALEQVPRLPLLPRRLDYLDAAHALVQVGVHHAELRAHPLRHRAELPHVIPEREGERDDEQDRH